MRPHGGTKRDTGDNENSCNDLLFHIDHLLFSNTRYHKALKIAIESFEIHTIDILV